MVLSQEICQKMTDQEIVAKSLHDLDYFSCLYQRYEPELLRYIHRMGYLDNDEAQDILQESFIKIWRNLNDYDPSMKLSSWLYRIVHNETVSHLRKKKSYGKDKTVDAELCRNILADEEEPSVYSDRDIEIALKKLDHLPEKYKEILILKFLESKSYEEISDILKIPLGTVAIRINRAKKSFRGMAGPHFSH
jgi:RNA polymerase sigma-70 factor (ECF subfamily)